MIPVVVGGLREVWFQKIKGNQFRFQKIYLPLLNIPDNILSFLGRMIPVVAGGLRETSLVPEDLPPLTKHT